MENKDKPKFINERKDLGRILIDFGKNVKEWFEDFINIEDGVDREGTIITIRKGTKMRGHSAWLLVCSIMVASLGLDLNSSAVIIGAMLISPLMSPILGVGLAVGINDKSMLVVSLQHYGVAILIALLTSFTYFSLTPFGDITHEISSRTKPTTLDVLVAFFGGVAGIISGSRKDQSNAIPGVAIATALMPPLCVTGFGLAKGEWQIMLNSFYLFFFNAFFVALATFLIVRLLKFDEKEYATAQERMRTYWMIIGFSVLMIVPSTFILLRVLEDLDRKRELSDFVKEHFSGEINSIGYEVEKVDSTYLVVLKLIGPSVPKDSIKMYKEELSARMQSPVVLQLVQDSDVELTAISRLQSELHSVRQVADRLQNHYNKEGTRQQEVEDIRLQIDSLSRKLIPLPQVAQEAKLFLPNLKSASFAEMQSTNFQQYEEAFPTLLVEWNASVYDVDMRKQNEEQLRLFVQQRAGLDTLRVISFSR